MPTRIKIDQKAIAEFCKRHHIRRMALFGSVIRDDFTPQSDIDILVEFEPGKTPGFAFFEMQDELSRLLARQVDLKTKDGISPHFRDEVLREAQNVYVADPPPRLEPRIEAALKASMLENRELLKDLEKL